MKFYSVDPYSRCQSCGHRQPRLASKEFCPTCGQEIKNKVNIDLISCQKCNKPLNRLLIGEKITDRHVFELMAYPELNINNLSNWKEYWIGKKVINEDDELINKGKFEYFIRTWPKTKDSESGKRIKAELITWDSEGKEIPLSKDSRPWVMVFKITQPKNSKGLKL
jgi:DNA-directed RNA polymerase subunit RPC12/RpoP